jgi:hypothetical protein
MERESWKRQDNWDLPPQTEIQVWPTSYSGLKLAWSGSIEFGTGVPTNSRLVRCQVR